MISKLKMISFMVLTFLALGLYSIVPAGALSEITVDNGLLVISADNYDTAEADIFSPGKYKALAVSADTLEQDLKLRDAVRNAFENSGIRVYLFGELTINDYKRLLDVEEFGSYTSIFDENGIARDPVFVFLSEEQESSDIFNIISFARSNETKHLLAKTTNYYRNSDEMNAECVRIITDDFDISESIMPITTARSGFNYRSYLTSSIYVNMDFLLYRDFSELDPDYDYFSVKTNICTVGMSTARIEVEHQLSFTADELIDYGSGDTNRVSNSFFISDDHCTWIINRHWILGELANELFSLDSSWAAADNCTGTNVKFRALFDCYIDSLHSPWMTIQIRFDY